MANSVDIETFELIKGELAKHPRLCGYYIVKFVELPADWRKREEATLTTAFQALDDHAWKPPGLCPADPWADYEVEESLAREHAIMALVGGRDVGHSIDTIHPLEAASIWARFRGLFLADAHFFCGVGLGNSEYVFQNGVIVVDDFKAGCLCVVESD